MKSESYVVTGQFADPNDFTEFALGLIQHSNSSTEAPLIEISQELDELATRRGDTPDTQQFSIAVRSVARNDAGALVVLADRLDTEPHTPLLFTAGTEGVSVYYSPLDPQE